MSAKPSLKQKMARSFYRSEMENKAKQERIERQAELVTRARREQLEAQVAAEALKSRWYVRLAMRIERWIGSAGRMLRLNRA